MTGDNPTQLRREIAQLRAQRNQAEQQLHRFVAGIPDPTEGCDCDTCRLLRGILRLIDILGAE